MIEKTQSRKWLGLSLSITQVSSVDAYDTLLASSIELHQAIVIVVPLFPTKTSLDQPRVEKIEDNNSQ